jgi:hypothetical protein
MAAWYRSGETTPPLSSSDLVEHKKLRYVRLVSDAGVMAIYRVRTVNGEPMLKKLKRWPAALSEFGKR